jgi:hypothetical protein
VVARYTYDPYGNAVSGNSGGNGATPACFAASYGRA